MDFCISRSTAGHSFTSPNPLLQSSLLSIHNIIYYYIILYHTIRSDFIYYNAAHPADAVADTI